MRWGKTVLIFQAVITLVIGMAFLVQVMNLDANKISELRVEMKTGIVFGDEKIEVVDIKERYNIAAYVLLVIGMIELMILSRLVV